jgi:two-component system response regulator NreC
VLDVRLPGAAGSDSVHGVRAHVPGTGLVLVMMEDNPAFAKRALESGALALVLKDAAETELFEAARRAVRGHAFRNSRVKDS